MIWIIIGVIVYLLSGFGVWKYIHIAHSEYGIWSESDIDFGSISLTIIPIINTMYCIVNRKPL
jgi:hypothetical protein